jgi:hypothetical protein
MEQGKKFPIIIFTDYYTNELIKNYNINYDTAMV